ncbi:HNH endonuclease [Tundrisphaera sp. TA3]|uniref:HNH endonuclease n=1 Tax=Tundrisphaera sp. TA3 TaxID=3435775 RepID=UPI003EBE0A5E
MGCCIVCGKERDNKSVTCEKCIKKNYAKSILGSTKKAHVIEELFNSQNRRCAYTGLRLELGVNASLDHIIPRSQGGSNDPSNLQWVHKWVNYMKSTTPSDEFLEQLNRFVYALLLNESDMIA